jgi:hypothetical protein
MSAKDLRENLKNAQKQESEPQKEFTPRPKLLRTTDAGTIFVRFLPNAISPNDVFYYRIFLHYGFFHPNFQNYSTLRCLGKGCPLCREAKKKEADKHPEAWRFKSTPNFLYYVVDNNGDFAFVRLSLPAHTEVQKAFDKRLAGDVNPVDLNHGRIAELRLDKIVEEDNRKKNKWTCNFLSDPNTVSDKIIKRLKDAPSFEDLYAPNTVDDLELILKGKKINIPYNNSRSNSQSPKQQNAQPSQNDNISAQENEPSEPPRNNLSTAGPVMRSAADSDDDNSPEIPSSVSSSSDKKDQDPDKKAKIRAKIREQLESKKGAS